MKLCLSPVLYNGITFAFFILLGNVPVRNDKLQMCVSGCAIPLITFFTIVISISLQSVDVLFLKLFTISQISFSLTSLRKIVFGFLTTFVSASLLSELI